METTLNWNSLSAYLELKWFVRYKLTTAISSRAVRNLLGNTNLRIGVWSTQADYQIPGSGLTRLALTNKVSVINKWHLLVVTHDVPNKNVTMELFDDEDNLEITASGKQSNLPTFTDQDWNIGIGVNSYPASNTFIDLNVTHLEADGKIISPWNK